MTSPLVPEARKPRYFHVRREDIHKGSALDVNPQFIAFDVVLRPDYEALVAELERLTKERDEWEAEAQELARMHFIGDPSADSRVRHAEALATLLRGELDEAREITAYFADTLVEHWHEEHSADDYMELHGWMGLLPDEYAAWVEGRHHDLAAALSRSAPAGEGGDT